MRAKRSRHTSGFERIGEAHRDRYPARHPASARGVCRCSRNRIGGRGRRESTAGFALSNLPQQGSEVISSRHTLARCAPASVVAADFCDSLCSQSLPVSWAVSRTPYISNYPSGNVRNLDQLQYFHLHPHDTAICSTCTRYHLPLPVRYRYPKAAQPHPSADVVAQGSRIPSRNAGVSFKKIVVNGPFTVQVVSRDIPKRLHRGHTAASVACHVHNAGEKDVDPLQRSVGGSRSRETASIRCGCGTLSLQARVPTSPLLLTAWQKGWRLLRCNVSSCHRLTGVIC